MIEDLKKKLKSLAIADAIIEPEWGYRYFSYNSQWGQNEWKKFGILEIKYLIDLEQVIVWEPNEYKTWAEDYYEKELDLNALKHVFNLEITEKVINSLNQAISYSELQNDLNEIGIIS